MPPALKLLLLPLLLAQAGRTRRRALVLPEAAGERRGVVHARSAIETGAAVAFAAVMSASSAGAETVIAEGTASSQTVDRDRRLPVDDTAPDPRDLPLRVLIVGDSSAAGVGVETQERALAGHLGRRLARTLAQPVEWQLVARSGVSTLQALALVQSQPPGAVQPADVALVVTGVNDVVDQVPPARAVKHRAALADWLLKHAGVRHVVFAPLPPIHQFPLLPQPLRWVAGSDARSHNDAASRWAATRHDVSHVPIALTLTPETMAADGFHPGEPVYRACGEALADAIAGLRREGRLDLPAAGATAGRGA